MLHESSVEVKPSWEVIKSMDLQSMARPALLRSWANSQVSFPDSNDPFCMLNHQRELTLARLTAAPTATSSAYF